MDSDLRVSRNTSQAEPLVWFKLKNLITLHLTPIILKTRIITLPAGSFSVYSRFPAIRETANQETNQRKGYT